MQRLLSVKQRTTHGFEFGHLLSENFFRDLKVFSQAWQAAEFNGTAVDHFFCHCDIVFFKWNAAADTAE